MIVEKWDDGEAKWEDICWAQKKLRAASWRINKYEVGPVQEREKKIGLDLMHCCRSSFTDSVGREAG